MSEAAVVQRAKAAAPAATDVSQDSREAATGIETATAASPDSRDTANGTGTATAASRASLDDPEIFAKDVVVLPLEADRTPPDPDVTPMEWIESVPPEAFFWGRDVGGNPSSARAALTRLAADPHSAIRRVGCGLYRRSYPEGHALRNRYYRPYFWSSDAQLLYAGPGAGRAWADALHEIHWVHQASVPGMIATVRRRLRSPVRWLRYVPRRNLRRLELTWLEVSVLESLAQTVYVEDPWEVCLDTLTRGVSARRVGGCGVLRPELIAWAAETDDLSSPTMLAKAADLQRELPAMIRPDYGGRVLEVWRG